MRFPGRNGFRFNIVQNNIWALKTSCRRQHQIWRNSFIVINRFRATSSLGVIVLVPPNPGRIACWSHLPSQSIREMIRGPGCWRAICSKRPDLSGPTQTELNALSFDDSSQTCLEHIMECPHSSLRYINLWIQGLCTVMHVSSYTHFCKGILP